MFSYADDKHAYHGLMAIKVAITAFQNYLAPLSMTMQCFQNLCAPVPVYALGPMLQCHQYRCLLTKETSALPVLGMLYRPSLMSLPRL